MCCAQVCTFQRLAFKHWPQLRDLALSNCGQVEKRETLKRALAGGCLSVAAVLVVGVVVVCASLVMPQPCCGAAVHSA